MRTAQRDLDKVFRDAERKRLCAVPVDTRTYRLLSRRVVRKEVVRVARGVYARSAYWERLSSEQRHVHLLRTLQMQHPTWVFCFESAGMLYGLPVSRDRLDVVHVAVSRESRMWNTGVVVRHVIEDRAIVVVDGVRTTRFDRTVFDCMRSASFERALAIADAALRVSGRKSSDFVFQFEAFGKKLEGAWRAVRVMRYADPCSESAGESIARAAMIKLGFCLPLLQVSLRDPIDSGKRYRLDFVWPLPDGGFVFGEFDGMGKYEDARMLGGRSGVRALADEKHREARLSLYGAPIVRLSYRDVTDPERLRRILDGYRIPRSDDVARIEQRFEERRSRSSLLFTVVRW